jgi:NAD(P)-binding Rossmann-like domain
VGSGLGGLISAIAASEAGLRVVVYEARRSIGGRARSLAGPYVANWGPHALYSDGDLWHWLDERALLPEVVEPPLDAGVVFRRHGRSGETPMDAFIASSTLAAAGPAPSELAFDAWASELVGAKSAHDLAQLSGVFSFHHAPGELAASFVQERLTRVTSLPPAARFVVGGWTRLIDRLYERATEAGTVVTTARPIAALPDGPVILAVPLAAATKILNDPSLAWTGSRVALVDVALRARPDDPYAIWDLDEAGWAETYTHGDPSLAPEGEHLVQAQVGLRPNESLESGVRRVEAMLDVGYAGWRNRVTWHRRARSVHETGALDMPGSSWRDRPHVDRGAGVFVVGDMVAAPGLLSEVVHASALEAIERVSALAS